MWLCESCFIHTSESTAQLEKKLFLEEQSSLLAEFNCCHIYTCKSSTGMLIPKLQCTLGFSMFHDKRDKISF